MQRDSFDRLLLHHLPAAQRFAVRLVGDPHAAEDLLHDAIVRAVKGADRFEQRSAFTTWLFQIIVNCFRDRLKSRQMESVENDVSDSRALDPSEGLNETEIGQLVAKRVSSLPPRQREVLVLVIYENMSVGDVAEVLGTTEVNVRVNLSYARARLREELAPYLSERNRGI